MAIFVVVVVDVSVVAVAVAVAVEYIDSIDLFRRFTDWRMRGCKRLDGWPFSTRNSSHCGVTLSMRAVSNRWHISHFQQLEFNTSPMPEFLSPFAIRHLGRPLVCFSLLLFQSLPAGIRQRNRWRHGAKVTHPPSVTAVTSSSRFLTWRVPESLLGGRYRQSAIIFRLYGVSCKVLELLALVLSTTFDLGKDIVWHNLYLIWTKFL